MGLDTYGILVAKIKINQLERFFMDPEINPMQLLCESCGISPVVEVYDSAFCCSECALAAIALDEWIMELEYELGILDNVC